MCSLWAKYSPRHTKILDPETIRSMSIPEILYVAEKILQEADKILDRSDKIFHTSEKYSCRLNENTLVQTKYFFKLTTNTVLQTEYLPPLTKIRLVKSKYLQSGRKILQGKPKYSPHTKLLLSQPRSVLSCWGSVLPTLFPVMRPSRRIKWRLG